MVAGREVTPQDAASTERLKAYWLSHIAWGHPGDYDECVVRVTKAIADGGHTPNPEMVKGLCANLHHEATGAWPGHAPAELALKATKS